MVVSIDDIKTMASVAANASISTKGGAVAVSAQSLNQIDPNKLWLVNLYAPFDGIEAKWKAADGTSAKMGVATGAAKAFLNNLQATLTSTGGISSSFSSWVSATAKSKKLALSGAFSIDVQSTQTRTTVAGLIDTRGGAARPETSISRR